MDSRISDGGSDAAVSRVLASLRSRVDMDIAFAAKVTPDGRAMRIDQICGGLTRSLAGLTVMAGAGLGGKSLVLARPVRVDDYLNARGITHVYDHAVAQEKLQTVAAMPVRVGTSPRYVVYVGNRSQKALGDRWLDAMAPFVRDLEHEIAVAEEVERRLRSLDRTPSVPRPRLSEGDLRDIASELAQLADRVRDEELRSRLEALRDRCAPGTGARREPRPEPPVHLTPREVAVLEQVALGATNAVVAEELGLLPNTVKSYLKSAMRKLGASNRVQAILVARSMGLIR